MIENYIALDRRARIVGSLERIGVSSVSIAPTVPKWGNAVLRKEAFRVL